MIRSPEYIHCPCISCLFRRNAAPYIWLEAARTSGSTILEALPLLRELDQDRLMLGDRLLRRRVQYSGLLIHARTGRHDESALHAALRARPRKRGYRPCARVRLGLVVPIPVASLGVLVVAAFVR